MAWLSVDVKLSGKTYKALKRGNEFSLSANHADRFVPNATFDCGGDTFKAVSITDTAQRGEEILVKTEVVKDDKSKTRRGGNQVKREVVSDEVELGQPDEDRNGNGAEHPEGGSEPTTG